MLLLIYKVVALVQVQKCALVQAVASNLMRTFYKTMLLWYKVVDALVQVCTFSGTMLLQQRSALVASILSSENLTRTFTMLRLFKLYNVVLIVALNGNPSINHTRTLHLPKNYRSHLGKTAQKNKRGNCGLCI